MNTPQPVSGSASEGLFEYLLFLADSSLVLGHRLSEWCGHAPDLEEDIALSNIALDLIGQATFLLSYAGKLEGCGRSEDDLAYLRDGIDYRNALLTEMPNGDFAMTIVRQFLFDAWALPLYERLSGASDEHIAAIAAKAVKEHRYHLRFSSSWVIRLGDGTEESQQRTQSALDELWSATGELFADHPADACLTDIGVNLAGLGTEWDERVNETLTCATLKRPADGWMQTGGRSGRHTEQLGYLLAQMQYLQRSHPGASW